MTIRQKLGYASRLLAGTGVIVLILGLLFAGSDKIRQPASVVIEKPYMVTSYQAGTYSLTEGPIPAKYTIQHGCVIIHAECGSILRNPGGNLDSSCTNFFDPRVPVGVPLHMTRPDQSYLSWWPPQEDGVVFKVLSENTDGHCAQ